MSKVCLRIAAMILSAVGLPVLASAQSFTENFDDITSLAGNGWSLQNLSDPIGTTNWFQGISAADGAFDAYNGAANAYIAADYENTTNGGTISNWLIAPNRMWRNGDALTFYTVGGHLGNVYKADRLEVRLSTNGTSTAAGTSATSVGDFTTLLMSINPNLYSGPGYYPPAWTQYTITMSGLSAPTSGRIAFRYFITNGGLLGSNSYYIGIDNVVYTAYVCPPTMTLSGTPGNGAWGQSYNFSLGQAGSLGAPSYAVTAGALPPGLTLSASGTISGVPTATGTFNFTATVSDASGCSASQAYGITIAAGVPGAPQNVSATAGHAQATVTWDVPANDGNGNAAITGYTATCTDGINNFSVPAAASPATVTGLTNGTTYTCTVTATNGVGTGPASAPSNSVKPRDVPGAPQNVSATAGDTYADFTWYTPASDGGDPITGYTVNCTDGISNFSAPAPGTVGGLTTHGATVTGLTMGTTYTCNVTATNGVGTGPASAPSNIVKPRDVPGAPQNVSATPGDAGALLFWDPPASDGGDAITTYTVFCSGGIYLYGVQVAASPATLTGLTNGKTYDCEVTATNGAGMGPASAVVSFQPIDWIFIDGFDGP